MSIKKIYSKKSFWVFTFIGVLVAVGINIGLYFGIEKALICFSKDVSQETAVKHLSWLVQQFELAPQYYYKLILPASVAFILLAGWTLWMIIKISMSKTFVQIQETIDAGQDSGKKKKDFVDHKIDQDRKRRLFLHTLSVFQREGRLLDFFDEDLSGYDDEQIGAAVRSIQEDCKKVVKKYIDPKPVIDSEEGEIVVVEKGFDIDAIKLIGNVSGEPPFEGRLKHRGWKADKREIPKLSDIQDSTIITPAEVEIQ
ncbi:MAG: DUF2760 domain-containing protein [Proteobacteria bacterium]|nr:DUF2760 domain-containing protein [Pseudomonadota bacterium]